MTVTVRPLTGAEVGAALDDLAQLQDHGLRGVPLSR